MKPPEPAEHILLIEQSRHQHGCPVAGRFDGHVKRRKQSAKPEDTLALRIAGTDVDLRREPVAKAAKLAGAP
jgi:hypothetical protein